MTLKKMIVLTIIVLIVLGSIWATGLYLMILSNKAGDKYNKEKIYFHSPLAFGTAKDSEDTAYTSKIIKHIELPSSISKDIYSLGFWFYVEELSNTGDQHILKKGSGNDFQPSIYLSKNNNNLVVKVSKDSTNDPDVCLHGCIEIADIPVKRWVYFYMNVKGTTINIYINGNLVETRILKVPIKNNDNDIEINGEVLEFNGLLSKLLYSNYVKDNTDIKKIYNKGPYGYSIGDFFKNTYTNYKLNVSKIFNFCNT